MCCPNFSVLYKADHESLRGKEGGLTDLKRGFLAPPPEVDRSEVEAAGAGSWFRLKRSEVARGIVSCGREEGDKLRFRSFASYSLASARSQRRKMAASLKKGENFELSIELNSNYASVRKEAIKKTIASMTVGKVNSAPLLAGNASLSRHNLRMCLPSSRTSSRTCKRTIWSRRSSSTFT